MATATHSATLAPVRRRPSDWTAGLRALKRRPFSLVAVAIIAVTILMALGADRIVSYTPLEQDFNAILKPPSTAHWLGTDNLGRDILSRILHGARITLTIGLGTLVISTVIGTAIALIAGYFGGFVDVLTQRIIDAWLAFPLIIFALTVLAALGPGVWQTIAAVSVVSIPTTARVVRGSVIVEQQKMYIEAARAMGASGPRLILNHILPNVAAPVLVIASLTMAR
ncbi:MAG: ABC transporter permease, partial [Chloroflexota bacterium]